MEIFENSHFQKIRIQINSYKKHTDIAHYSVSKSFNVTHDEQTLYN